jgi:hypothetical protein
VDSDLSKQNIIMSRELSGERGWKQIKRDKTKK